MNALRERANQPRRRLVSIVMLGVALHCPVRPAAATPEIIVDQFDDLRGWTSQASEGARVEIARDTGRTGMGMRIDFDLEAGGFVIVRKPFAVTLPKNYAFKFSIRGQGPPNNLEFKLVDRDGKHVWWHVQPNLAFPAEWREVTIKKPRIERAWGPDPKRPLTQIGSIEFAITAGKGGRGSVWIDGLRLVERDVITTPERPPKVSASTALPERGPERVLDDKPESIWRSGTLAADQWLQLDFGKPREYGGLVIDWDREDYATAYAVQMSEDGEEWNTAYTTTNGHGGRDYIYMPDAESRYIRLDLHQSSRNRGYGIRSITVKPFSFSASPNQFFDAIAADAPVGTYPKYFSGKQTYWTVIGVNGGDRTALMNEEGMLEVEKGGFSIEPFLYSDGRLITWEGAHATQALADGYLPIPSVTWHPDQLRLTVTAFAAGNPDSSTLYATYRIDNVSDRERDVVLFLAIRPFQVLPPWQTLNMVGGVTPIQDIVFDARSVWVNNDRVILSLTPPDRFGGATFEEGLVADFLLQGKVPHRPKVSDPLGYASGALEYGLRLEAGRHQEVHLAVPLHPADVAAAGPPSEGASDQVAGELERTTRYWTELLGRVEFTLPPELLKISQTIKSTLAYTLINRSAAAIHPGPRTYARAWIRDGALTSAALLETGFTEPVREFLAWYSGFQFADGRVPCCVDERGADPVPEHDSNGQLIYTVAEYYRFTRDIGFLTEMWPHVVRAVDSIAALRQQRLTDEYQRPEKRAFYGLLPESISHEGYAAHPVHSYWDDFFALRGLKDAASLAIVVDDQERAAQFATLRDAFRADLYASIERTMAQHKLDYVPASVELGDLDPSSTAIAVSPGGELENLPAAALARTFDLYLESSRSRQAPGAQWKAYSPYELRNVGVLTLLGRRDEAVQLLETLLEDQRPPGWNEWQEIIWRDPAAPRFIGDMPHTWVASGFVRSVRTLFAYEREHDRSLVLAAGIPDAWLQSDTGVGVTRLPTYHGVISYRLRRDGANRLRLDMTGDLSLPPGHIIIKPPLRGALAAVSVNGEAIESFDATSARISEFPATVVLEHGRP